MSFGARLSAILAWPRRSLVTARGFPPPGLDEVPPAKPPAPAIPVAAASPAPASYPAAAIPSANGAAGLRAAMLAHVTAVRARCLLLQAAAQQAACMTEAMAASATGLAHRLDRIGGAAGRSGDTIGDAIGDLALDGAAMAEHAQAMAAQLAGLQVVVAGQQDDIAGLIAASDAMADDIGARADGAAIVLGAGIAPADRRAAARIPVDLAARLTQSGQTLPGHLANVSAGGAKFVGGGVAAGTAWLEAAPLPPRAVRVVTASATGAGLAFAEPLDETVIAAVLAGLVAQHVA